MKGMMDTTTLVSPEELIQWWAELAQDEQSPDYYELTEYGELVLSSRAETDHQRLCAEIAFQLRSQLKGEAVVEAAVLTTTAGLRVPDVTWMPQARWDQLPRNAVLQTPELVVEVLSPGNRTPEMNHKIQGYLQSGSQIRGAAYGNAIAAKIKTVELQSAILNHGLDKERGQYEPSGRVTFGIR